MLKGYNRYEVSASANAQSFAAKTHRVEANVPGMGMGGMGGMGGSGGFGGTASAIKGFFDKLVMEGIIMDKDAAAQRRMARDMYRYDAVCGGAVDLMALLPWSNATLSGVADKKILEKYQTCVQSMNMMMLMPEATVDHLVNAQFIGSMQWDANESTFIGIAPQDPEQCTFQHVPFYGKDPLISLKFSDGFKQLVEAAKKDPRAAKMLSENAPNLASQLARKEIPLDPDTTVYVPRRTFASQIEPTSFLTRAMPVWIIEKALMRGTIELSYKRQRSIMHILLGGEDWEPTVEEATNYVNLFQAADSDPTSAIIATRPDVLVTEVRGASDFWRYDEIMEATSAFKYRALGFNENFLTGDASFNTMENALSTFLERLKYLRFVMSQRIFYNKIFPYIAKQNDFKIKGDPKPIEVTGYYEDNVIYSTEDRRFPNYSLFSRGVDTLYCRSQGYVEIGSERFNPAQYHIPHLSYVKALKPEADSAYLDIMKTMEEKGIPIPLQMWASASGFNINEVMRGYDDDIKYRKAINAYLKKMPKSAMKKESDEDGAFEEASFREHMIAALAKDGPIGLGRRKFTDRDNEMRDPDTRKVLSRRGRAVRLERLHKNGAEAMTRIAARENRGVNERIQAAAQRLHTYAGLNIPVPKSVAAMEKSARMKRSHIIRAASL